MAVCCKNISRFYNALARHRKNCCKNITRLKKLDPPRSSVVVTFLINTRLTELPMVAMTSLREI
jgi:hypothetical protein